MQLVIADTGPVNYLLLIGHIEILPTLFEKVILPSAVRDELANPDTPLSVRNWIADPPGLGGRAPRCEPTRRGLNGRTRCR